MTDRLSGAISLNTKTQLKRLQAKLNACIACIACFDQGN